MRGRRRIFLLILGALVLSAAGWRWFRLEEPVAMGHPLGQWLKDLPTMSHPRAVVITREIVGSPEAYVPEDDLPDDPALEVATKAILEAGPKAVPFLLPMLHGRDSKFFSLLHQIAGRHGLEQYLPPLPSEQRKRVFYALVVLDDEAFPAAFSVLRDEALPQDVQSYVLWKLRGYPAEEAKYREVVQRLAGSTNRLIRMAAGGTLAAVEKRTTAGR